MAKDKKRKIYSQFKKAMNNLEEVVLSMRSLSDKELEWLQPKMNKFTKEKEEILNAEADKVRKGFNSPDAVDDLPF